MTDREAIQSAIERVQSGEISAQQATEILLDVENAESLQSLIDRLGAPPDDIISRWCDQLRSIASAHEAELGESLPEIELDQWAITEKGDLLCRGRRYTATENAPPASEESLERIQAFQQRWGIKHHDTPILKNELPAISVRSEARSPFADQDRDPLSESRSKSQPLLSRRTTGSLSIAGIVGCVIAAWFVLSNESRRNQKLAQKSGTESSARDVVTTILPTAPIGRPSTESIEVEPGDDIVTLETFDAVSELESEAANRDIAESELSISLNRLLPPLDEPDREPDSSSRSPDGSAADLSANADRGNPESKGGELDESNLTQSPGTSLDDDQPEPEESPQPTRQSTVMAIQLGEVGDVQSKVMLADHPLSGLKLDFPTNVPLEVKSEDSVWTIRDNRKDVSVATIRSSEDETTLSWMATAKQSPSLFAVVHGRISADGGSTIFLRPTIESEPWGFNFDRSDVMPTWDLVHPLPPQVARLEVQFNLPEKIEYGWVEPIDPTDFRRAAQWRSSHRPVMKTFHWAFALIFVAVENFHVECGSPRDSIRAWIGNLYRPIH